MEHDGTNSPVPAISHSRSDSWPYWNNQLVAFCFRFFLRVASRLAWPPTPDTLPKSRDSLLCPHEVCDSAGETHLLLPRLGIDPLANRFVQCVALYRLEKMHGFCTTHHALDSSAKGIRPTCQTQA